MPNWSDFQGWADSVSLWQAIGWAAGLIGLVVFLVWFKRKGWPWLLKTARAILRTAQVIDAVQGLPDFIDRTDLAMAQLRKQVENSHTSNLRDDITDALETAKRVEEGVQGLYESHETLATSVSEINVKLANDDKRIASIDERTQPRLKE